MLLVTGGAGAMGSRLVRRLCRDGRRVRVLALEREPGLDRLRELNCEIVLAAAAWGRKTTSAAGTLRWQWMSMISLAPFLLSCSGAVPP